MNDIVLNFNLKNLNNVSLNCFAENFSLMKDYFNEKLNNTLENYFKDKYNFFENQINLYEKNLEKEFQTKKISIENEISKKYEKKIKNLYKKYEENYDEMIEDSISEVVFWNYSKIMNKKEEDRKKDKKMKIEENENKK